MSIDWNHRSGYDANFEALLDRLRRKPADLKWDQTQRLVAEIDRLREDNDRLRGRECAC